MMDADAQSSSNNLQHGITAPNILFGYKSATIT
jgi:hypothetical protein